MPRIFNRNVEDVVRVLTVLCKDEKQPAALRARCGELVLSAYGLVTLTSQQKPRHQGLKQIQNALELSGTDRKIAGQVRTRRKEQSQKLKEELRKI